MNGGRRTEHASDVVVAAAVPTEATTMDTSDTGEISAVLERRGMGVGDPWMACRKHCMPTWSKKGS